MAPRQLDVIFAGGFRYEVFLDNISEIFSHSIDTVKDYLITLSDDVRSTLRTETFIEFCSHFSEECLEDSGISLDATDPISSNLRKRYKAATRIEDIVVFSLSLVENSIHKDILKHIISSKTQTPEQQTLSSRDLKIIEKLSELSDSQKLLSKENKILKEKLGRMETKIDYQEKLLREQEKLFHEQEKLLHDFIHTAQFAFEGTGCQNKTGAPSYKYSPSSSTGVNNDCSPIKLYSKVVENDTLLTVDLPPEKDNRNMLNPMSAPDPKSLANIAIKIREIERSKDELQKSKTDSNIPQKNNYSNSNLAEVSRNLNKNFVPANLRESTIEDDGFQLVINRNKKGPVFGSKSNSQKSIAGSPTPKTMDIFIGGIDPTLSNDSLSHYMREFHSL